MVALADLLAVCPNGAWVTEEQAIQVLGLNSKADLQAKCNQGLLPHVYVEHGGKVKAPPPYNSHAFFYIQSEGSSANQPAIDLLDWVNICRGDPSDAQTAEVVRKYTGSSDTGRAFQQLQDSGAIATSLSPGNAGSGDYRYSNSGGMKPSKAAVEDNSTSDIITRPDGTKVRRVRRASSAASNLNSLAGFLSAETNGKPKAPGGSRSVSGDGEIYVRPDGKKSQTCKKINRFCSFGAE